jgi:hypothetical protein
MTNRAWLEHRRALLERSILYVEDQRKDLSRETEQFLTWARDELAFVRARLDSRIAEQGARASHASQDASKAA